MASVLHIFQEIPKSYCPRLHQSIGQVIILQWRQHFSATTKGWKKSIHSVHWGINLPPPPTLHKNTTPLFLAKPPLNWNTVQALPFYAIYPYILVFREPRPLKVGFFNEPLKY